MTNHYTYSHKFKTAKTYRKGVEWIAMNDEPLCTNAEEVADLISVCLLADIFALPAVVVAHDVLKCREENCDD